MKRRVFNVLAGVSLVLCLGTAVLWIRSYWRFDDFQGNYRPQSHSLDLDGSFFSMSGRLRLLLQHERGNGPLHSSFILNLNQPTSDNWWSPPLGADGGRILMANNKDIGWYFGVALPWYVFTFLFALVPALAMAMRSWASRSNAAICSACGYDLRATPERCPECGTIPTKPIGAKA